MRCFHRTSRGSANRIIRNGFRDSTGYYLTSQLWTGVWISATPLDCNEGAEGDVLLAVEIDGRRLSPFEWIEEGKHYSEFLVPAKLLNRHAKVYELSDDGLAVTRGRRTSSRIARADGGETSERRTK